MIVIYKNSPKKEKGTTRRDKIIVCLLERSHSMYNAVEQTLFDTNWNEGRGSGCLSE